MGKNKQDLFEKIDNQLRELEEMSVKQRDETLFRLHTSPPNGHMDIHTPVKPDIENTHPEENDIKSIQLMLANNKTHSGVFNSIESAHNLTLRILADKIPEIVKFMESDETDKGISLSLKDINKINKQYGDQELQKTGSCYIRKRSGKIEAYDSEVISILIRKTDKSPLGFYVHTVYPGLLTDELSAREDIGLVHRTVDNSSSIAKKTEFYKKSTDMGKRVIELMTNPSLNIPEKGRIGYYTGNGEKDRFSDSLLYVIDTTEENSPNNTQIRCLIGRDPTRDDKLSIASTEYARPKDADKKSQWQMVQRHPRLPDEHQKFLWKKLFSYIDNRDKKAKEKQKNRMDEIATQLPVGEVSYERT